jgi:rubredoxin
MSPGDLYNILVAAGRAGVRNVQFGLRQQLLIPVDAIAVDLLLAGLRELGIDYETDHEYYPNIVSSYPAEEVFINNTWLSEGVYKDIFDGISRQPRLKINVSDSNQSFTPMLTGNINWVASAFSQHYWHLFIRFPKTNIIYEWTELIYTNDVARLSEEIESIIFQHAELFYDNPSANGAELFELVNKERYITKPADQPAALPQFNLPYYEGLNRHNNKYWLGVYRRDELFSIQFLKDACRLCLDTKIGLLCSTPWKTIIVKGIEEKDKGKWSRLLEKYNINMRHAANELNFQVEDNSPDALSLKHYLVKKLSDEDTRTFGVCIGIKTKKKTEVFSSILIKRKPLLSIFGLDLFHVYDILCAEEFNPNKRTAAVVSSNNFKFLLGEQLRRTILSYGKHRSGLYAKKESNTVPVKDKSKEISTRQVHQCNHCLTVYDETLGEQDRGIAAGTTFEMLPADFTCSLCEGPKMDLVKVSQEKLGLQPI